MDRLKVAGGSIIAVGFLFGMMAVRVSRPGEWLNIYFPLIMGLSSLVGASIGLFGWIGGAIQRRNNKSNPKH